LGTKQAQAIVVGTAHATLSAIAAIPKATLHRWAIRAGALHRGGHFGLCPTNFPQFATYQETQDVESVSRRAPRNRRPWNFWARLRHQCGDYVSCELPRVTIKAVGRCPQCRQSARLDAPMSRRQAEVVMVG
jgi:hypothetical protein